MIGQILTGFMAVFKTIEWDLQVFLVITCKPTRMSLRHSSGILQVFPTCYTTQLSLRHLSGNSQVFKTRGDMA